MDDETTPPVSGDAPDPRSPAGDDAAAGARLLDEQQARIAALRAAVLSGRVRDDDGKAFDYETFFTGRGEGSDPTP